MGADWYIRFPSFNLKKIDGTYRTDFGPCVNPIGVIYGNTNKSVAVGLRARMFACRIPPKNWVNGFRAWDNHLTECQRVSVKNSYPVLRAQAASHFHLVSFTDILDEVTSHHDDPHIKRDLRVKAFTEELEIYGFASTHWGRNNYVTAKLKKDELAKFAKAARLIVDLGVPMSLVGFRLTKFLKEIFAEPFYLNGGVGQYCDRPSHDLLQHHMLQLEYPDQAFHVVFFSDDSCWSVRQLDGEVKRFNVDIKSCDASHRSTFDLLYAITPPVDHPVIDHLIDQLSKDVYVRDVNVRKRKVILHFDGPTLFSGSTLTTVLNNLAQWLAFACVNPEAIVTTPERAIVQAYESAGFMVTIDAVPFEQIQFLKHSPVYDTDHILRPVLNLGVMLRASGTCRGELPPGPSFEERAKKFQSGLIQGMYPYTHFTLVDRMRGQAEEAHISKHVVSTHEPFHVSDDELYKRYNLNESEIDELNTALGFASVGDFVSLSAIDKILALDYDSAVNWKQPEEYFLDE